MVKQNKKSISSNIVKMLSLRKLLAKNRPKFLRQESWRYKRLASSWRKPRGTDSKMRLEKRGWPKIVKTGYRGPKVVRGLHPSGLNDILVHNEQELNALNPASDAARLSASIGARKREMLIKIAKSKGLRILNPTGLRRM